MTSILHNHQRRASICVVPKIIHTLSTEGFWFEPSPLEIPVELHTFFQILTFENPHPFSIPMTFPT